MIVLRLTCGACPEQYDAYLNGKQVGYLRLRWGFFRVDYPDCGGEVIYQANPKGDGVFEEDERNYYLRFAVDAIERRIRNEAPLPKPEAPHVLYMVEKAAGYLKALGED
jgi:hypothetical protein